MATVTPQFRVVVYRAMDMDGGVADADEVVIAESAVKAAAVVFGSIGGGYADYVGVSAPDEVDVRMDGNGFVEDICYMYCTYSAGEFSYDVRL